MTQFNYIPLITNKVIKTKDEQNIFFMDVHPNFLIPDFSEYPNDICLSYLDFLEKNHSCKIYDQDGGEVHSVEIIDHNTGLTRCIYTAYGISLDEGDVAQDVDVKIEGYVVEIPPNTDDNISIFSEYVFVATKVFESYKFVI